MYWYYKYPLLLILFLVLFGLGYLGFRSWFPPSDNDSGTEVVEVSGDPIAPVSGTEAPVIAEAKTGNQCRQLRLLQAMRNLWLGNLDLS